MKSKNVILPLILICGAVVIAAAISLMAVVLPFYRGQQESRTTDTHSSSFEDAGEKLEFLSEYLISPGEVLDAEFHIIYHDNSTGIILGPSDWDIRVALKVRQEDIPLWLDGFEPVPPGEIGLSLWDGLSTGGISWPADDAKYYKRADSFSYLVTFPDADIILKAYSTMQYLPT